MDIKDHTMPYKTTVTYIFLMKTGLMTRSASIHQHQVLLEEAPRMGLLSTTILQKHTFKHPIMHSFFATQVSLNIENCYLSSTHLDAPSISSSRVDNARCSYDKNEIHMGIK